VLEEGVSHADLRDEIFLQLMKQLRDNPSPASMERGWGLLHLCLLTFPPSDDAENYVEHFLRSRNATECVVALHTTLYRGPSRTAPDMATVEAGLSLESSLKMEGDGGVGVGGGGSAAAVAAAVSSRVWTAATATRPARPPGSPPPDAKPRTGSSDMPSSSSASPVPSVPKRLPPPPPPSSSGAGAAATAAAAAAGTQRRGK
jgi:hypothetical protein